MSRRPFLACLAFVFLASAAAPAQESQALGVDDVLDLVEPSDVALAPDGERLVYVRSELNWKENRRDTRLIHVQVSDGASRDFTRGPSDRSPSWSPDGRHVAFLRRENVGGGGGNAGGGDDAKKKAQLWAISTVGGEAFPLTELSEGVLRFVWAPDSSSLVFAAKDPKTEDEKKALKDGDDAIFVFEGPNGQGRDRWSNVWTISLADREPRQVTHEKMLVSDIDVSPDGEHVAFVFRRENARNNGNLAEVGMARLDSGAMVRLTDNEAPESDVRFSRDGNTLAYLAPDDASWELAQRKLYLMDVETRRARVASGAFGGDIRDFRFHDDGVRVVAGMQTDRGVFRLDPETGRAVPAFHGPGVADGVSFSADGRRAAFVWSDAVTPPEVAVADLAGEPVETPRTLTDLNPNVRHRALASVELIEWKSRDGLRVEGLLYLPPGTSRGEPVPLILEIHGGPAGVFTRSWRGDRHVYAGLGYATLAPNVRGSSAYGDDFLRGNMNDIGGGDFDDLMTGVDHVVAESIADPEHLGVRGWSYGGILGGWVVTHTDRFRAASLGAMVSDWRSEYGQGFNHDVRLWYIGGDPWSNAEGFLERSPLTHVQNVTTPTLLLHGEEDDVDTIEQSMNFFNALWEKGVPTRFIRFPREGHGIEEPRHVRVRLAEEIAWMQKYVRGVEWSVPPRVDEKESEKTTDSEGSAGR